MTLKHIPATPLPITSACDEEFRANAEDGRKFRAERDRRANAYVELSPVERLILVYTASRKSSYMGKDRYAMAQDDMRYSSLESAKALAGTPFPSREQWDQAKADLVSRSLLNKAGAITIQGRNTIGK